MASLVNNSALFSQFIMIMSGMHEKIAHIIAESESDAIKNIPNNANKQVFVPVVVSVQKVESGAEVYLKSDVNVCEKSFIPLSHYIDDATVAYNLNYVVNLCILHNRDSFTLSFCDVMNNTIYLADFIPVFMTEKDYDIFIQFQNDYDSFVNDILFHDTKTISKVFNNIFDIDGQEEMEVQLYNKISSLYDLISMFRYYYDVKEKVPVNAHLFMYIVRNVLHKHNISIGDFDDVVSMITKESVYLPFVSLYLYNASIYVQSIIKTLIEEQSEEIIEETKMVLSNVFLYFYLINNVSETYQLGEAHLEIKNFHDLFGEYKYEYIDYNNIIVQNCKAYNKLDAEEQHKILVFLEILRSMLLKHHNHLHLSYKVYTKIAAIFAFIMSGSASISDIKRVVSYNEDYVRLMHYLDYQDFTDGMFLFFKTFSFIPNGYVLWCSIDNILRGQCI